MPFLWPWKGLHKENLSFSETLKSRTFTFGYLLIIWILVWLLDFGSTRNCGPTWQLQFICDQSVWMNKIYSEPFNYFLSFFTATFFHNGLDHILFVTVVGFLIIVQAFEVRNGTLPAIIIFFTSMVFICTLMGFLINWGFTHWPEISFFDLGMKRSWMGGSAGAFGVFGALSHNSRQRWITFIIIGIFETINLTFYGINLQISVIHTLCAIYGFTVWGIWLNRKKENATPARI